MTVQPTHPFSILPTKPLFSTIKVNSKNKSRFLTFNKQWLLPGQKLDITLPPQLQNESSIAVEPNEQNVNPNWPQQEILQAKNNNIQLTNSTDNPIHLGKEVKNCKLIPTEDPSEPGDRATIIITLLHNCQ